MERSIKKNGLIGTLGVLVIATYTVLIVLLVVNTKKPDFRAEVSVGQSIKVEPSRCDYDPAGKVTVVNGEMTTLDQTAFQPNQFYRFDGPFDSSENPTFKISNRGKVAREIQIKTLSGWVVPFSGKIYLQPEENFQFGFRPIEGSKYWFCWINVLE